MPISGGQKQQPNATASSSGSPRKPSLGRKESSVSEVRLNCNRGGGPATSTSSSTGGGVLGFLHPHNIHDNMRRSIAKLKYAQKQQIPVAAFPSAPMPRMSPRVVCVDVITLALVVVVLYVGIIQSRNIGDMFSVSSSMVHSLIDTSATTRSIVPGSAGNLNAYYKLTYRDVINTGDLTSYLNDVFVPQMFLDESTSTAEERVQRRVFGDNLPASPIRFGASKVSNNSCEPLEVNMADSYFVQSALSEGEQRPCWGPYNSENRFQETFGGKYPFVEDSICSESDIAVHFLGTIANYDCARNAKDVYFNSTRQEVWNVVKELLDDGFISPLDTRMFSIEFYTFSPSTEVFARMTIMVEISSGGGFFSTYSVQFVRTQFAATTARLLISFVILFALILFRLVWSFIHLSFAEFSRSILADVLMAITVFILVIITGQEATSDALERTVYDITKGNFTSTLNFHQSLSDSTDRFVFETWVIAVLVGLVVVKVLTLCRISMRLYIFVLTFRAVFFKLMAILVLFVIGITGFALVGVILFGSSVRQFRSMGYAYNTLFQILIGNTEVYRDLKNVSMVASVVFFWAFIVSLLIVLLNLVIAVLIDAFQHTAQQNRGLTLHQIAHQYARRLKFLIYFTFYGNSREFVFSSSPQPTRLAIEMQARLAKYNADKRRGGSPLRPSTSTRSRSTVTPNIKERNVVEQVVVNNDNEVVEYPLVFESYTHAYNHAIQEEVGTRWWGLEEYYEFVFSRNGMWKEFYAQNAAYNMAMSVATWKGDREQLERLRPNGCKWHVAVATSSPISRICIFLLRKLVLAPFYRSVYVWHYLKAKSHEGKRKFGQNDPSLDVSDYKANMKAASECFMIRLQLTWAEFCDESEVNVIVAGENEEKRIYNTLKYVLADKLPMVLAKATDKARYDLREDVSPVLDDELAESLNEAPFTFEEEWENTVQRAKVIDHVRDEFYKANDVASNPVFRTSVAAVRKRGSLAGTGLGHTITSAPSQTFRSGTWSQTWWQSLLATQIPSIVMFDQPGADASVRTMEEEEEVYPLHYQASSPVAATAEASPPPPQEAATAEASPPPPQEAVPVEDVNAAIDVVEDQQDQDQEEVIADQPCSDEAASRGQEEKEEVEEERGAVHQPSDVAASTSDLVEVEEDDQDSAPVSDHKEQEGSDEGDRTTIEHGNEEEENEEEDIKGDVPRDAPVTDHEADHSDDEEDTGEES